jgi:hypothetical protein
MKWVNHALLGSAAVLAGVLSGSAGARASDTGAVIAIPGHQDVPVIIDGRDASYRLVVGDWGLARPGAVPVTVYGPPAYQPPDGRGYFPSTGRRPRSGRQEIEPATRDLPPPAPSYHRSWSAASRRDQATIDPPKQPDAASRDGDHYRDRYRDHRRPRDRDRD